MGITPTINHQLLLPVCAAQKPSFTLHPTPSFKEVTDTSFKSFLSTPHFQWFLFKREKHSLNTSACCDCCLCNIPHILTLIPWLFTPICSFPSGLWRRGCWFSLHLYKHWTAGLYSKLLEPLDGYYQLYHYYFGQSCWLHYCLPFYSQQVLSHHPICWRNSSNRSHCHLSIQWQFH